MAFVQLLKQFQKYPLTRGNTLSAVRRAVAWQISSCLAPGKIEYPFIGPSRLLIGRGMMGATGNIC